MRVSPDTIMGMFLLWVASTTPRMMEHLVPNFHAKLIPTAVSIKVDPYAIMGG
jgi:hypothetical protein